MANVLLAGTLYTGAGVAVVGATVEVFDRDTTTPVRATFAGGTDANGDWNFSYAPGANARRVDVRITNGSSISFLKYDDQIQVSSVETANLRIINPAFTFEYDIVPAAITAARQLNLPLITATDTLVSLGLAQTFSAAGVAITVTNDLRVNGIMYVGDNANANMTAGLTLNQGAADNQIFTLKSSDVATGLTTLTNSTGVNSETDDFAHFMKLSALQGGLIIHGLATGNAPVIRLVAYADTDSTLKTTSARAPVEFMPTRHNGANALTAFTADSNLLVIRQRESVTAEGTRFIFDFEGSAHADVEWIAFDNHNDIELLRGVPAAMIPGYREKAGRDFLYNLKTYEDMKLIGRDSIHIEHRADGQVQLRGMVNQTGMMMLHHSAILQMHDHFSAIVQSYEARLDALEEESHSLRTQLDKS